MTEPVDWSLASFEGNRRAQHTAFLALSFREKLIRLEQMAEVQRRVCGFAHGDRLRPDATQRDRDRSS